MDDIANIVGLLIAITILLMVAFPDRLLPQPKEKKKKVGSTYWGAYAGQATEEPEDERVIEVERPAGKEKVIGGSHMYHIGRGTSFRM